MRLTFVATSLAMTLRDLSRKRLMLALGLLLPAVFFWVVFATTREGTVAVRFAASSADITEVAARPQALLFISIAAAGVLSAFVAASLVQRQAGVTRRLVLCGYRPSELLAARLLALVGVVAATGLYIWLLLAMIVRPAFPPAVSLGIGLGALVYGCYGLLVGAVLRRDLEMIFAILVLLNIDAGWLQNPIYYAGARSTWLIESLPAHFPSQVAYLAAFTQDDIAGCAVRALAYGAGLLVLALAAFTLRMRVAR